MRRILAMAVGVALLTVYIIPEAKAAEALKRDVGPNTSPGYEKECGSCHFPHQPGWLSERSWRGIMGTLGRHFGENIAITPPARDEILRYLAGNSADAQQSLRSVQVIASLKPAETPTSVSQVPYVAGIHGGLLDAAFGPQPNVKSLANCSSCHLRAKAGDFAAVQYTRSDASFRSNDTSYAHVLTPAEMLALRKK
jgi:hypothetical protein